MAMNLWTVYCTVGQHYYIVYYLINLNGNVFTKLTIQKASNIKPA